VFQAFDEIWPGGGPAKWTRGLHSVTSAKEPYRVSKSGGQVVLHEYCYGFVLPDPEKTLPQIWNQRGLPGTSYRRIGGHDTAASLIWYRTFPEQSLFCRTKGVGRVCLDFWPVPQLKLDSEYNGSIYNRWPFSSCAQRAPTLMALSWPGPAGAESTVRYELFCEAIQDAEAAIVVSEAMDKQSDELGADLARECRAVLADRLAYARNSDQMEWGKVFFHMNHYGWQDLERRLYDCAAKVDRAGKK
jgi:hypothetical protein